MSELINAIKAVNVNLVRALIEKGANVNEATEADEFNESISPLFMAFYRRNVEIIKLLLENNADILKADDCGFTALHLASVLGDTEIITFLLDKGAAINAVLQTDGSTPLHDACATYYHRHDHNIEAIKLLIKNGANVNATNNDQQKPLALTEGNVELAKLIIPHMLLEKPVQEKPDYIKNNQELSLFWDEQFEKINDLLREVGYQLTADIVKKITSQQKTTTLCSLAYQFFKPLTIKQNLSETENVGSIQSTVSTLN